MRLIGISGLKGAGKGTVGQFLAEWCQERDLHCVQRGFADLLKLSAYRVFEPTCTLQQAIAWCDQLKVSGWVEGHTSIPDGFHEVDGRVFLQRFGTEAHRDVFGDDFWIDQLLPWDMPERARTFAGFEPTGRYPSVAVVTDVRFPNECERIIALSGSIWDVTRPGLDSADSHASEIPVASHFVAERILNGGSLDDLRTAVREVADNSIGRGSA